MGRALTIEELRAVVAPLAAGHGLRAALLFGSYARGEASEDSDIDLLVDGGDSFRPLSVYALGEEVRGATGKRVDVLELSELEDGPFRERVLREAVALWGAPTDTASRGRPR